MITRCYFFLLDSAFYSEGALASRRTRFWMFITPIWAPENKAWVCISLVEGTSAPDYFGNFVMFTAAPLTIFDISCCWAWDKTLDSCDHSAESRCCEIHHCWAVCLCRFYKRSDYWSFRSLWSAHFRLRWTGIAWSCFWPLVRSVTKLYLLDDGGGLLPRKRTLGFWLLQDAWSRTVCSSVPDTSSPVA